MFGKSFKSKIIAPSIITLVVLTIILTTYVTLAFLSYTDTLINEKIKANITSLKLHIEDCKAYSRAAAVSILHNQEAFQSVKNRNREEILRVFTELTQIYQNTYFTVTDAKGIVLARTHAPDRYGDSIAKQQNIKDAMEGEICTSFESGIAVKVAARTGVPVFDTDGTLVGIVSAGVRFDTDVAVDALKALLHSEITVFLKEKKEDFPNELIGYSTTIIRDGKRIVGTPLDPTVARIIEDKREYFGKSDILGVHYRAFYMPLLDSNNDVFAAFFIGIPLSELKAASNVLVRNVIVISFIGLAIATTILYWVISSFSKPLIALTRDMDRIEEGRLSIVVGPQSDDEIGFAGQSLQKMVNTIHKLIDDINTTISEHEEGNMDYQLDTESFQGAYRLLADRIIALSSLGWRDQLTGLPNRRSFDSRLDSEWKRAERQKLPLSVLMIDVDKFKSYNDKYGHQQGDMVLQIVANTLLIPIRHAVDFVARWGGEEFVILLPHTNSVGAVEVAERIRKGVETAEIPSIDGGPEKKVTISIGVCSLVPSPEITIAHLISNADGALYHAKETGRNKVCQYEGDT